MTADTFAHLDAPPRPRTAPASTSAQAPAAATPGVPPLQRGTMPAQPWRGWRGRAATAQAPWRSSAAGHAAELAAAPWRQAARRRRAALGTALLLATGLAAALLWQAPLAVGAAAPWQLAQRLLFVVLFAWVCGGALTALAGLWVLLRGDRHALSAKAAQGQALNPAARTALVMPICNEDVATVFSGLRATCESLQRCGAERLMEVFVLSDTREPELRAAELAAWQALRRELQANGSGLKVYYRWRARHHQRKAGNVADFCRRWGRAYRYMVVMDADSVMSGPSLVSMVRLMEQQPQVGIVQTLPRACGHDTLHARAQQFASRLSGRLLGAGLQYWQLGEAHYWGHNAIIRIAPFMAHCALAPLPGQGALSGEILSHDFAEAALMRRAGWQVWQVADLDGSYEQQPPHLLAELQRDRRWCWGNLQNARLITEPGLAPAHRAMLAAGAMSYLSAPLWLAYLALGAGAWLAGGSSLAEGWQALAPGAVPALWAATAALLLLPRALGVAAVLLRGEAAQHGGTGRLLGSAAAEAALSALQAPLRMVMHSGYVLRALLGRRGTWQSPPRLSQRSGVAWPEARRVLGPVGVAALALLLVLAVAAPGAALWLAPVALPLLLAVPLAVWTSRYLPGLRARTRGWWLVPEELQPPSVLQRARALSREPFTSHSPWWRWQDLARLAPAVQLAMGPRHTGHGLRGAHRLRRVHEIAYGRGPALGTPDLMALMSEPHSLRLLQAALAGAAHRAGVV